MNMFDYLDWRGDLTFDQSPLNYIDNLIFSYVSYVDFKEILTDINASTTIQQACKQYYQLHTMEEVKKDKSLIAKAPLVLLKMSQVNRFKDIIIHHYVDILEPEKYRQFSAIQFDIDENTTYLAFRGTDDSIVGWQEDLIISYKIIEAEKDATDYLNKYLDSSKTYYVGGHSKGGNLALFACSQCNKELLKSVKKIFNNDGPNLSEKLVSKESIESISSKAIRISPEFSVFGMIYADYPQETIYVKSSEIMLMQHDCTSWQVLGANFVKVKEVSPESQFIKESLDEVIEETTYEEKEEFIKEISKAFETANIFNLSELFKLGLAGIIKLLVPLASMNGPAKVVANKLILILPKVSSKRINLIRNTANDSIKEGVNNVTSSINQGIENVNNTIQKITKNNKNEE